MNNSVLQEIGVRGWAALEPVVVAALATESTLLLVGPHGTAKSMVLERLAAAMELEFRHYNASTINFDDLVGFPVPDQAGERVKYLRTPLDCWEAEAIFIDEVSRCRPDMANRLFPLIHERRVQGQRLEALRYRWGAMNPVEGYLGAAPLDAALADRFAWVIEVPSRLSQADRLAVIRGETTMVDSQPLKAAVRRTKSALALTRASLGASIADYVEAVCAALELEGLIMSGRRMRLLFDNCVAVVATGMLPALKDAVFTALQWSIPHRAHGDVTGVVVARAHAAAVAVLARPEDDISRRLLLVRDPVERVEIALQTDDVDLTAAVILDARAQLGAVAGVGLSVRLFAPLVANHSDLPAVLFEALAEDLSAFEALGEHTETVHTRSKRYHLANAVARATSGLAEDEAWIESVLWVGFRSKKTFDPDDVVRVCRRVSQIPILGGVA